MNDLNETSYYEVALTNRQVVVAFVILLTLVLSVFLCGVWVGRSGESRVVLAEPTEAGQPVASDELANMEEFKFFEEQQAKKESELDKPDLGRLAAEPSRETTLAQDVGAQQRQASPPPPRAAQQATPPPSRPAQQAAPPPPRTTQEAPPRQASPPPRQAAPPRQAPPAQASSAAPSNPAPAGSFVVQVFSSHDQAQALKVQKDLQGLGHRAFLSTVDIGGQTRYRVRVGPFADRNQAEKVKVDVRNKLKLDSWVTAAGN